MVKIRLTRRGRKKYATYDVVIADARAPRDGRFIEKIGLYNPNTDPALIELDEEKAVEWLLNGAQPTDTVKAMLSYRGILLKKHLQVGVNKGAITQEEADKKFEDWKATKEGKIAQKVDSLEAKKTAEATARLEAEAKVNEARAEALKKREDEIEAAKKAVEDAKKAEEEAKNAPEEVKEAEVEANTETETPKEEGQE